MDWEQLVGSDELRHAFVEHFEPLVSSDDGREALQALAERVHRFGITPASSPRTEEFDDDLLAKKPLGAELSESYVDGAPKRFLLVEFTDPFGARDYDPHVGRWTAPDPIGFGSRQVNLFVYAGNGTIVGVDPFGTIEFAAGIEFRLDAILGELGGSGGVGLEISTVEGPRFYAIAPVRGIGVSGGASCQANVAIGDDEAPWEGLFDAFGAAAGIYAGSVFYSPGDGPGWKGLSFGYGAGLPIGAAYSRSSYIGGHRPPRDRSLPSVQAAR